MKDEKKIKTLKGWNDYRTRQIISPTPKGCHDFIVQKDMQWEKFKPTI